MLDPVLLELYAVEPDRTAKLEVYRCGDSHWHYMPRKSDESRYPPWYRYSIKSHDYGKFRKRETVYLKGRGSEQFTIIRKDESGFYHLMTEGGSFVCTGRYGKEDWMLYREEELSKTPWVDARGPPPAYHESPSGK